MSELERSQQLVLTRRLEPGLSLTPDDTWTLPWEFRRRSRFVRPLDSGRPCGCVLERGRVLRGGDWLVDDAGILRVQVAAAREPVSCVESASTELMVRAAYHLGNRHVPLDLTATRLLYLHDHVLDDMVRAMGLQVSLRELAFEPEAGAYAAPHSHESGGHHAHEH